jgi:hypothetical protein
MEKRKYRKRFKYKTIEEQLLNGTKEDNGCLIWTGVINNAGYGRISIKKKIYSVHRIAYETWVGPIPEGMFVCHTCDNRKCCKPTHLWLGTSSENMKDCHRKGRLPIAKNFKLTKVED